jgi:hypothetical protein
MRSIRPDARAVGVVMSKSWYFRDELPQLITNMFMDVSLSIADFGFRISD